jgi:putative PIN family toxin of toxin-antitoxin system
VSALIAPTGKPAAIIRTWLDGKFMLLTCAAHVDELRSTLQKPRVSERIRPHKAGRLVKQIKRFAEDVGVLPPVVRSPDPMDDFLLAVCEAGHADYLVTGDKSGLLVLRRPKATQIISARKFVALFNPGSAPWREDDPQGDRNE